MKRYFVFALDQYYPKGGMEDCVLKTNDLEEAKKMLFSKQHKDEAYIYDAETDKDIWMKDFEEEKTDEN